ncbi:hypothetical protein WN55_04213 [Dufourea novaeangliae]|uniref:F-box domain-containing protein n=1 Tax=Dufourea novaeangliae TaxID=178035 RepID=A0A154NVT5_DUFNO|nr:hypothetical protein WN55_04213 [Dufourea novaeangliae]
MEYFRSFLRVIGLLEPAKVDFISDLPPEVSQLILGKLDPKSLVCAMQVSRSWSNVCRSDKNLRRTATHHKKRFEPRMRDFLGPAQSGQVRMEIHRKHPKPVQAQRIIAYIAHASDNMEYFRAFLRVIGLLEPTKVDFISELPPEVSQLILRKLDPESLLCAAQVSRNWLSVCSSDRNLRRTARHHNRRVEREMMEGFLGNVRSEEMLEKTEKNLPFRMMIPRKQSHVRIEANAVFGRLQRPRKLPKYVQVRPNVAVRPSRCIRIHSTLRLYNDNMEYFRSFLRVIGLLEPAKVDFISDLPPEVSQLLLRKLDPESLFCAAQVSRIWLNVCRSDRNLRRTARRHKRRIERKGVVNFLGNVPPVQTTVNIQRQIPVSIMAPRILPHSRIEANAMFGRIERPRKLPKYVQNKKEDSLHPNGACGWIFRVTCVSTSTLSDDMEYFRLFLRVVGLLEPANVDFISELPPSVSQLISRACGGLSDITNEASRRKGWELFSETILLSKPEWKS